MHDDEGPGPLTPASTSRAALSRRSPGLDSGRPSSRSESHQQGVAAEDRAGAQTTALRILAGADQSEQQLRRRLERRGYSAETASEVVEELRQGGWINDAGLASGIAQRRLDRGYGRRRIIADLAVRGVGASVVNDALGALETETEEAAVRAVARRLRQRLPAGRLEQPAIRRLAAALERRGFDHGSIRATLRELDAEDYLEAEQ